MVEPRNAPVTQRGTVLVVDDDAAMRLGTARMLQSLGYEVRTAADSAAADEQTREPGRKLDFLVCDFALPDQSGAEVAALVKLRHPDVKVLFVSGYPRSGDRELHGERFLQKPYDRDALARELGALAARA